MLHAPGEGEEVIAEAYFDHGVKTFALDTLAELDKIVRATNGAATSTARPDSCQLRPMPKLSLASKFGAEPSEIKALLFAARQAADALGICFHVGSQAMSPAAFAEPWPASRCHRRGVVTVDIVDVGGGFPSVYPGWAPAGCENYLA